MLSRCFLHVLAMAVVSAKPINVHREIDQLDEEAFKEAQQRDDTATRAFSDVKIKTSDGKCLSVDPLSGDFRANLTPVQIADCGSTDGQGWDIIISGKHHSNEKGRILIVSTLTQACFNADPRRKSGDQVILFSCGGRADGGGEVTDSQLFLTDGEPDNFRMSPQNGEGFCLISVGQAIDIAECDENAPDQRFTVGGSGGN